MSTQQQRAPQGHYSGANPIPTIQKFVENLDKDKKERDRLIDEQKRQQKDGVVKPHEPAQGGKAKSRKTVTDPTTGSEVVIEDINLDPIAAIENAQVDECLVDDGSSLGHVLTLVADRPECQPG